MPRTSRMRLASFALLTLALTACGSTAADPAPASTALTVTDGWVKAADSGMTAAFGTLENSSDKDLTLVSAESEVSPMELHEVSADASGAMVMHPKDGGFVVPAHGSLTLEPGGLHVMLMDLSTALEPGMTVDLTLVGDDGTRWTTSFPVRTFTGANESYQDGDEMGGSGGMDPSGSPMPTTTP